MDANFRLKNQMVSSYLRDPGLSIGLGYFILKAPYEKYVLNHTSDEDVSGEQEYVICTNHAISLAHALDLLCWHKGQYQILQRTLVHRSGGCFMHSWWFLMQLVDLHKGERYNFET